LLFEGNLHDETCTWLKGAWNIVVGSTCNMKKKGRVIQNEIMIFHNQPQLRAQNPHPYNEEMWKKIIYNIRTTRCCLHYWRGPSLMIFSRESSIWICPRILLPMNPTKFSNSGFQDSLTKSHRCALCTSSRIIGRILYWNLTTLRMLWMVVEGMLIS